MPLRLRSLSGLLIMAMRGMPVTPAPSRRGQDALDQVEIGRLVDVDRGLGDGHHDRRRAQAQPAR